jgi:uncharacterized integral membrane protein
MFILQNNNEDDVFNIQTLEGKKGMAKAKTVGKNMTKMFVGTTMILMLLPIYALINVLFIPFAFLEAFVEDKDDTLEQ